MNILNQAFAGLKLQDIANAEAVANLLDKFNLRWTVSKRTLHLSDGTQTPFFGIVRDDNNKIFTTCKDAYVPYQNSELAELLIRISEKSGYSIHKGGSFNFGGKVYLQLDTNNSIVGIGKNKDKVSGYVTGINSHDGTHSLKWGVTNTTISCENTFASAAKQVENRVRHTNSMHDRVDEYLRQIEVLVKEEQSLFDKFIKLSERPITKSAIVKVVKSITDIDLNTPESKATELYSGYAMNRSKELMESISSEVAQKGETLWGLFSGVTHYTTHKIPVPNRENARVESKYVGNAMNIDNKIFSILYN